MKCDRFEERLQEALDERRSPELDRELQRHAKSCDACRELLAAANDLVAALSEVESSGLSPFAAAPRDVRTNSRRAVAGGPPVAGVGRWRHWTAVGSAVVAASLLFALLVSSKNDDRSGDAVGEVASADRAGGGVRERSGRRGHDVLGLGMLSAPSKAPSPMVATSNGAAAGAVPSAPRVSLPAVGGVERREGREGMEWTDALAADHDDSIAEWVNAIGGSISTIRETKMEGVPDVTERFRPLARSVHSVMEALKGTWRGARGERPEREPETSWVAEDSWIA